MADGLRVIHSVIRFGKRTFGDRQVNLKGRPAPYFTCYVDVSTALLDDSVNGDEAQAGSIATNFRCKKGLEYSIQNFRRHAGPGVAE